MYIVDRFEEEYVILEQEDKTMLQLKRDMCDEGVKQGDVVQIVEGRILPCVEETKLRQQRIHKLMESLWE